MQTMVEAALAWLSLGVPLIPCQPNSKRQVRTFGAHMAMIETTACAWVWFGDRRCNLGLCCGGRAGLICLDFDSMAVFDAWRAGPGADLCQQTRVELSRRGAHVLFFCADLVRSARIGAGPEIKGPGSVVLASPSVVAGVIYQVLNDVNPARVSLADLAGALPDLPPLSETRTRVVLSGGKVAGNDLVAKLKRAYDLVAEFERLGVALRGRGDTLRGRCPFHPDHCPSLWVIPSRGLWGCPVCFPDVRGLDVVNLYAFAHKLMIKDAIAQMALSLPPGG